jgi:hypothetical protein
VHQFDALAVREPVVLRIRVSALVELRLIAGVVNIACMLFHREVRSRTA